jgi:hypothetical protein
MIRVNINIVDPCQKCDSTGSEQEMIQHICARFRVCSNVQIFVWMGGQSLIYFMHTVAVCFYCFMFCHIHATNIFILNHNEHATFSL